MQTLADTRAIRTWDAPPGLWVTLGALFCLALFVAYATYRSRAPRPQKSGNPDKVTVKELLERDRQETAVSRAQTLSRDTPVRDDYPTATGVIASLPQSSGLTVLEQRARNDVSHHLPRDVVERILMGVSSR